MDITIENQQSLELYSELLKKDKTTILNEALKEYFENKEEELLANDPTGEGAMTNLSFDEFWDDVEL